MKLIKLSDVQWKLVKYLRIGESHDYEYSLILNEPLASWDVWDYWERERIHSMRSHLSRGDILFDIGTEQGWCNLVYADMVGPENMVLIEPTKEFWGNIKALWEKNFEKPPLACFSGFFSDKTTTHKIPAIYSFPKEANNELIDRNKYQYIHANDENVVEMKLDDYVARTGIVPTALTMDTEGSELLILRGAEQTLKKNKLKVWVSIHPDLGLRDYGIAKEQTIEFMESLGYTGVHLATDHEEHWYFWK